jgi:Ca2+/Na+ antiporter
MNITLRFLRALYIIIGVFLVVLFHIYVGFAIAYDRKKAIPVIVALVLGYLYTIYTFVVAPLAERNNEKVEWIEQRWNQVVDFEIKGFPVLKRFAL